MSTIWTTARTDGFKFTLRAFLKNVIIALIVAYI